PVITDFGFACKRTSELVKNITGTPQFFSPEHFKAIGFNATLNIKDDVWATAVTVHEIFFERYPAYLTVTGCEYISFDDLNKDPSLSKKIYESMRHFQEKIEPKSDMLMKLKKMFAFDARDRPSLSALLPIEIQQEEVKPLDKPNQIVIIRED
ncbi:MAG: protein kinase domain-containing protein, partial [Parachlamydiaceae bacterium]